MIEEYDPNKSPLPEEWLSIPESDRVDLIAEFHEQSDELPPEGGWEQHALFHCMIENQIALGEEAVGETVKKLIQQSLSRHEAVHAIAAVMAEEMFPVVKNATPFDSESYRRRLHKLSAKRWLEGRY